MEILKDKLGKISSKRIVGIIAGISGIAIAFFCIFLKTDSILAGVVLAPVFGFSAACFGLTLGEKKE
jgi:drug/metabolite transporter (DMT)-like permease